MKKCAAGWDDYVGSYETIDDAKAAHEPREYGWAQITDLDTQQVVAHTGGSAGVWTDVAP
jgi:hypothetical protein